MTNWRAELNPKPEPQEPDHPRLRKEAFDVRTKGRAAAAVRDHILRVYEIDPEPDQELKRTINYSTRQLARNWQPRGPQAALYDADTIQNIRQSIAQCAQDYWEGFYLFRELSKGPKTREGFERYNVLQPKISLYDIYTNHLTNATQARLEACGVDAATALRINAYIIKNTVDAAQDKLHHHTHIRPDMRPSDDDAKARAQVATVGNYWRQSVPVLKQSLSQPQAVTR